MGRKKLLALGVILASASIVIAISFQFVSNHRWYWNAAPLWGIIVMLAAAFGGFLTAYSMAGTGERRLWLMVPGGILGLVWIVSGIGAFGLAFPGMNYFSGDAHISWDSYYGDYLVGWFNIRALQLTAIAGLPGGFLVGRALQKGVAHS